VNPRQERRKPPNALTRPPRAGEQRWSWRRQIGIATLTSMLAIPTGVGMDLAKDVLSPPPPAISCTAAALETMKVIDAGGKQFLVAFPDPKVDRVCGHGALKQLIETYQPPKSP
jgi:hypothetical protein